MTEHMARLYEQAENEFPAFMEAIRYGEKVRREKATLDALNNGEPTLFEAIAAPTFRYNHSVGWIFNTLPAGPLGMGGTCPTARSSTTCVKCYAQAGRFNRHSVKRACQRARLLVDASWVIYTAKVIHDLHQLMQPRRLRGIHGVSSDGWFHLREHVSGDYHSTLAIMQDRFLLRELKRAGLPAPVSVWVPTRVWPVPDMLHHLRQLQAESDEHARWIIRPSALDEGPAPVVEGLAAGSSVGQQEANVVCPKILNHNSCREEGCSACHQHHLSITYPLHGQNKYRQADELTRQRQERMLNRFNQLEQMRRAS